MIESTERQVKTEGNQSKSYRNQLITEYLPYVKYTAQRIAMHLPSYVDIDDLISSGIIGLIEATERYDPDRNNNFINYAMFRIKGAIQSELRSQDFLSRSTRKKTRELEKAYVRLEQKLGRPANDEEVANEMRCSINQVYETKKMIGLSLISLEELGYASSEGKENLMSYLVNEKEKDALTMAGIKETEKTLAKAIKKLPDKNRIVVSLYYSEELTMKEIGEVLKITESRVSQIHAQALLQLRKILRNEGVISNSED